MTRSKQDIWMHRFAWMLAVSTLFLVALGGIVTTKGVGMAVPDWPTTFGHHMFFFPFSQWVAGVFDEHSHRVWASIVGLLTAVMLLWVWCRETSGRERWIGVCGVVAALGLMGVRVPLFFVLFAILCAFVIVYAALRWKRDRSFRWIMVVAFAAVIIQGVLGGLRVTLDQYGWGTVFGIFHASLAQLFFLLVGSLALFTSKWWQEHHLPAGSASFLTRAVLFTTSLIFIQLILGAVMRHQHAGLAVPDFPFAYGKLWPATDPSAIANYNQTRMEAAGENPITAMHVIVHMAHRITACAIVLCICTCAAVVWRHTTRGSPARTMAVIWVLIVIGQGVLGAYTVWSQRKVDVTTAHVAGGALTFLTGWLLFLIGSRKGVENCHSPAFEGFVASKQAEVKHA